MSGLQFGKYQLGERLAVGGMAEIFLAQVRGAHGFARRVVIKRLLPHLAGRPEVVGLFLDEARLLARLHHPRVVQVLDLGAEGGCPFQALEYLDGLDLAALLRRAEERKELLSYELGLRLGLAIAEGLAYLHGARDGDGQPLHIVHGDLAPSNVMVTRVGEVKLIDLGMAQWAGRAEGLPSGGTAGYLAPEVGAGQPATPRSDLFGLGKVLSSLLAPKHRSPLLESLLESLASPVPELRPASADDVVAGLRNSLRELGSLKPLASTLRPIIGTERRSNRRARTPELAPSTTRPIEETTLPVEAPWTLADCAKRWAKPALVAALLIASVGLGVAGFSAGWWVHSHQPKTESAPAPTPIAVPVPAPVPVPVRWNDDRSPPKLLGPTRRTRPFRPSSKSRSKSKSEPL
jgi:serine/threonine protein kinase